MDHWETSVGLLHVHSLCVSQWQTLLRHIYSSSCSGTGQSEQWRLHESTYCGRRFDRQCEQEFLKVYLSKGRKTLCVDLNFHLIDLLAAVLFSWELFYSLYSGGLQREFLKLHEFCHSV